jgi:hypothetical protein
VVPESELVVVPESELVVVPASELVELSSSELVEASESELIEVPVSELIEVPVSELVEVPVSELVELSSSSATKPPSWGLVRSVMPIRLPHPKNPANAPSVATTAPSDLRRSPERRTVIRLVWPQPTTGTRVQEMHWAAHAPSIAAT